MRGRSRASLVVVLLAVCAVGLVASAGPAQAADCTSGLASDFNGDGVVDVAIGDPDATVNGLVGAGRAHVVLGAGKGSQTVSQADLAGYGAEVGDGFGFSLASVDFNGDKCADLVVGAPFEAVGALTEAGVVHLIPGSPAGLNVAGHAVYRQGAMGIPGNAETGDRFGYSVAAGKTGTRPFIVAGAPGDAIGTLAQAGSVSYIRADVKVTFDQDSTGVFGTAEAGDQYGYAVAATGRYVAVGGPGEAVTRTVNGTTVTSGYAGTVGVFNHTASGGVLGMVGGIDQDQPGEGGVAEAGDWFGRSLSMVDYIPAGGTSADLSTLLAVGSPGEAIGAVGSAGRIVTINADGTLSEIDSIDQDDTNVEDGVEVGDYFGWSVVLANRAPGSPATWQNLVMAAGVPGEDSGAYIDNGGVQAFSMVGAAGDKDTWTDPALATAGRTPASDTRLGQYTHATSTHLFIADPWSATPAVYGIPWGNLIGTGTAPVVVFKPGKDGLPATGVGTFGAAIA